MRGRRKRGTLGSGAIVALTTLLLVTSCTKASPSTEVSPDDTSGIAALQSAPVKVRFRPDTCPFEKARKLVTDLKIECGVVRVPQDRDNPRKEQVDLSVAVIRSPNPNKQPDPIVYLEGGPGGSALAGIDRWITPPSKLLDDRDLILIDQRGTGYSSPRLWCDYEFRMAADDAPEADILDKCIDRLKKAKIDFTKFGTKDAAADVDAVREALGVTQWNLFGVSYGTRLALRVMHDFPTGIRSVVLDSTVPPRGSLGDAPLDAGRAIRSVLQACQADAACGRSFGNIEDRLYRTIDKYNATPARFRAYDPDRERPVTRLFTGDDFVDAIFTSMYRTSAIPNVAAAVAAADNGDMLAGLQILYGDLIDQESTSDDPNDSSNRPGLSNGLYLTVECREDFPFSDWETTKNETAELNPSLAGALLQTTERTFHECATWPHGDPEQNPVTSVPVPTLVLSGSFDPITPPAWGQAAAADLPAATFMLFNGAGHGAFLAGDCPMAKITTFVADPSSGGGPPCDLPPVQYRTR